MEKTKRPLLLLGNTILLILSLFYIVSQISKLTSLIILFVFIIIFLFLAMGLKTVNYSKKEFKKGKWFTWIGIILFFIYDFYEIIRLVSTHNNGGYVNILYIALLFITFFSMFLSMCGILTRVIDNKITYDEHIKKEN